MVRVEGQLVALDIAWQKKMFNNAHIKASASTNTGFWPALTSFFSIGQLKEDFKKMNSLCYADLVI